MKKTLGAIKRKLTVLLIVAMSINSFGAIVSDNDGSAFITKSEFDALKSSFQVQIDTYNQSIDSKIDGAIASYLAGISLTTSEDVKFLVEDSAAVSFVDNFRFQIMSGKRNANASAGATVGWAWMKNKEYITDYYGTEYTYPWGQCMFYDWDNDRDLREKNAAGNRSFFSESYGITLTDQVLTMVEFPMVNEINTSWYGHVVPAYVFAVELEPTEAKWDYSNNKIYKNLVAVGRKDGTLFFPSSVFPGVSCRMLTGNSIMEVSPEMHYNANFSTSWKPLYPNTWNNFSPVVESGYAFALRSDHLYIGPSQERSWFWHWGQKNFKLYQQATNVNNHQDLGLTSTWEQGYGSLQLSNLMCIANKVLYVSCVGGTSTPAWRRYNSAAIIECVDPWFGHSYEPTGTVDYQFGPNVVDPHTYKIKKVSVGGPDFATPSQPITWDETEVTMSCPEPLMNCEIKDLGSTVLRDNDGLMVKIGDGLPVCSLSKKGTLTLVFKVTSSDNQAVKLSFKYKGFQETGDYLKDNTGALWNNKSVTSGTTYTVSFPIETINETIYCGILNGDNTGVRSSKISLISGNITYDT